MSSPIDQQLAGVINALKSNRPADAERACRAILSQQPNEPNTLHMLGLSLLQQKRHGDAIDPLRRAAELQPNHAPVLSNLGIALRASGQLEASTLR